MKVKLKNTTNYQLTFYRFDVILAKENSTRKKQNNDNNNNNLIWENKNKEQINNLLFDVVQMVRTGTYSGLYFGEEMGVNNRFYKKKCV